MMGYYLFDNPRTGLAIATGLTAVLVILYLMRREKMSWAWILIGPASFGLLLALDLLVETNREQLERLTRMVVQAAEDEAAGPIVDVMSPEFSLPNGMDRTAAAAIIELQLSRPLISNNHIDSLTVLEAAPQQGAVELAVTTLVDPKSAYALVRVVQSRWRFEFARPAAGGPYQATCFDLLEINRQTGVDIWREKLSPGRF